MSLIHYKIGFNIYEIIAGTEIFLLATNENCTDVFFETLYFHKEIQKCSFFKQFMYFAIIFLISLCRNCTIILIMKDKVEKLNHILKLNSDKCFHHFVIGS